MNYLTKGAYFYRKTYLINMKLTLQLLFLGLFVSLFNANIFAQSPNASASLQLTLQCVGGTTNRAGIAYNPNQQYYYSVNAGADSYPIETFSSTGAPLATIASGYSYRGFWWNPNNSTAEGKVWSTFGIGQQNLNASFFPAGNGVILAAGGGPDAQSCADYDWVDDEVLYYYNGNIYRYTRVPHAVISSTAVTGLPVAVSNLNSNTATYTNIPGMEIGLYDYVNKTLYFINKMTGAYVASCQLPSTAPASASFQMSFENDYLWLFNTSNYQWEGYNVINQCSTASSITASACVSYTSPSGNNTWTVSDVYMDTIPNAGGCDSVITIDLTVIPEMTNMVQDTICYNGSVVVNGTTYDALTPSGTEVFTNIGPLGCDSTVTIDLTILPELASTIQETICNNESLVINGTTYDAMNPTGTEVFSNIGSFGCDSTVTINLNVLAPIDVTVTSVGATLTSSQVGGIYQWLDCDNGNAPIGSETNQSFTPSITGNYAVVVTVDGCSDTSACTLVDFSGIDELSNQKKELVMIIDLTGRQTEFRPNTPLIFIYSDGTRERVMDIQH